MSKKLDKFEWVNECIKACGYNRYLEIGLKLGRTFTKVVCDHKECVDIVQRGDVAPTYLMPSDTMFKNMPKDHKFDIIFIDGCHEKEQVMRDFKNSVKHLNEGGIILMHDVNPTNERMTKMDRNGNVWETFLKIRRMDEYDTCVYEDEYHPDGRIHGNSIGFVKIRPNENKLTVDRKVDLKYFLKYKNGMLNFKTEEEIKEWIKN